MRGVRSLLALLTIVVGCGSDNEFEEAPPFRHEEDVKIWATSSSALGVYVNGYEPIAIADGHQTFLDPVCPETSDDGTTLTITGGCTDQNDREWTGRATVVRDGGERTLTLDGFDDCDGTVVVRETGPSLNEFRADLAIGRVTFIEYDGIVEGGYTGRSTWNGSGRIERKGVLPPTGVVEATTADEVVDDEICSGQPVSGTTTLQSRGDTAVVTYDGATDCDDEQNARLSVNGDDRGLISGIHCATNAPGGRGRTGAYAIAFALAALLGLCRRGLR
jgi:hypothetical protein